MIIFIQARYNSKRLYGKVLKKLHGKNLLEWMNERIISSSLNLPISILTSINKSDDLIYSYCKKNGINIFRGDLNNVISRFIEAGKFYKVKKFIRLSGDSPFLDPLLIKQAIEIDLKYPNYDLITNVQKRTFPKGQSVEIVNLESLIKLSHQNLTKEEQEHVTKGFYNRSKKFKIKNFESYNKKFKDIQLSVDTEEDFNLINSILNSFSTKEEISSLSWDKLALIYNNFVKSNN